MPVEIYCASTSLVQGGRLDVHLNDASGIGRNADLVITEFGSGTEMRRASGWADAHSKAVDAAADREWGVGYTVDSVTDWPSGLYAIEATAENPTDPVDQAARVAYFAVRAANPGQRARILVSIPFPTWHAYSFAGVAGASPYWNEQPDRRHRVSLRRPTDGPGWETPILQWLSGSGFAVEYCSSYDLHDGMEFLRAYQLLVCIGHDEYWTAGMRDTVEGFLASGGNVAFLTGNTCWWQFRWEDDRRTFVCYRDATQDPLTGVQDQLVTVEWSSAPVNRPENHLTGVSFRRGAGHWTPSAGTPPRTAITWTARFADHWAFEGTGLADGDSFGQGTVGYETDAADIRDQNGVPRVTGQDGTPPSFVVLATADLDDWRAVGQGGAATMGTFRAPGGGTVFTVATTGWGYGLANGDPTVDRLTRNVLERLSERSPGSSWERIGHANRLTAMVACENKLFATDRDNVLWVRDPVGQNVTWEQIGRANPPGIRAMAAPREAMAGEPVALYAVTFDGALWSRPPLLQDLPWLPRHPRPVPGVVAIAASYTDLFAATAGNDLLALAFADIASKEGTPPASWMRKGHANEVVTMTNLNGRLYCITGNGTLWMRLPLHRDVDWTPIGEVPDQPVTLAGHAGKLFLATENNALYWRDAVP